MGQFKKILDDIEEISLDIDTRTSKTRTAQAIKKLKAEQKKSGKDIALSFKDKADKLSNIRRTVKDQLDSKQIRQLDRIIGFLSNSAQKIKREGDIVKILRDNSKRF